MKINITAIFLKTDNKKIYPLYTVIKSYVTLICLGTPC